MNLCSQIELTKFRRLHCCHCLGKWHSDRNLRHIWPMEL